MADNFNVKNYLRENNLGAYRLLNETFDGFGGVHDLNPIGEAIDGQASLELNYNPAREDFKLEPKCKKHNLTFKVIQKRGAAGGLPVIKIMGSRENIIAFIEDGYIDDINDDISYYTDDIQEYGLNKEYVDNLDPDDSAEQEYIVQPHSRMEGLVNQRAKMQFTKAASQIINELEDDGFDASDVVKYLKQIIDELFADEMPMEEDIK